MLNDLQQTDSSTQRIPLKKFWTSLKRCWNVRKSISFIFRPLKPFCPLGKVINCKYKVPKSINIFGNILTFLSYEVSK